MAIDLSKIITYADVKKLDDEGLVEYAKAHGVELPKQDRSILLSKCASLFLAYKNDGVADTQIHILLPLKEEGEAAPVKAKEPKAKEPKAKEPKTKDDKSESFTAAIGKGQDFPRCPYCGTAITVDNGVRDGNNLPVCNECADKVKKSKEKVMSATKKANKAVEKKAAKKTASTKTERNGNAEALKKARETKKAKHGGETIGSFLVKRIKEAKTKTNIELAEEAKNKFGSNTSSASVAWYRNKIKNGEL